MASAVATKSPSGDSQRWFQIGEGAGKPARETGGKTVIRLRDAWRLSNIRKIAEQHEAFLAAVKGFGSRGAIISGEGLSALDTSGALLVLKWCYEAGVAHDAIALTHFKEEHKNIFELVFRHYGKPNRERRVHAKFVEIIGEATLNILRVVAGLLSFIGETAHEFWRIVYRPKFLRLKEFFVQLELVCLDAIPIVAMVTCLIGIVVAYLFAQQSEKYGINIFIVESVAISMCREMSPIIVAIIVAGRSGSSFTAQIGTMKLNEEIDALNTLGLSSMRVLVFPRFLALILAMPLLVFVGDVAGIFGGMLVADFRLGITMPTFIERLPTVLPLKHVYVGLVKAPVFAAFIAVIGCRMGLTVENNARSVGLHTTSTVVQSVVSVILLNAAFAVIFVELGI